MTRLCIVVLCCFGGSACDSEVPALSAGGAAYSRDRCSGTDLCLCESVVRLVRADLAGGGIGAERELGEWVSTC